MIAKKLSQLLRAASLFFFLVPFTPTILLAQPQDLPWDPDPDCGTIVTEGIAVVTCGTSVSIPVNDRYSMGLVNINGALPAAGRIDVTLNQDMWHHPAWKVDSIGNIFGVNIDWEGNIYVTASSNYSSDFFFFESVIQYGEIGGGAEDLNAAGTVYRIDGTTGQPTVFAVLPQQAYAFTQITCEGSQTFNRNTGPGLGNITCNFEDQLFYVTNFEDGRIYRLDGAGNILDSYDPLMLDNGAIGPPGFADVAYGIEIDNDGSRLFFGTVGDGFNGQLAEIHSIDLNPDGSFMGTVDNSSMPAGATWDNYVGTETLHHIVDAGFGFSSMNYVSDLEMTPNEDLLVGRRQGCQQTLHTSYNHNGAAFLLQEELGGIYNALQGEFYISDGVFADQNAYGGVAYFENPAGGLEFVFSCADMLSEEGPHGIGVAEAYVYGSILNPLSPLGAISYTIPSLGDAKGIGGDVHVFRECFQPTCAAQIATTDINICSEEPFDLTFVAQGGSESSLDATWTDENGDVVDPLGLSISHTDCAPGTYTYFIEAVCQIDPNISFLDSLEVTVVTNDLSPFFSIIEEPCFIDLIIDPDCADYIEMIGDIPVINPGDSGSVVVQLVQTTMPTCDVLEVELNYNCGCLLTDFVTIEESCTDGTFFVEINFNQVNSGDGFTVFDQDGEALGTFSYDELPITLGPFIGDAVTEYTLFIEDLTLSGCEATTAFGPVYCNMSIATNSEDATCLSGLGSLEVTDIVGGLAPYEYSIDGGLTFGDSPFFPNIPAGIYDIVVQDATGAAVQSEEVIVEPTEPILSLEAEVALEFGDSYQINLLSNIPEDQIGSILWTPATGLSCTDCLNPVATPVENQVYTVIMTDINGCEAEAQIEFRVDKSGTVYIPNIFTPNNDGNNDLFIIYAKEGTVREIRSFLVFSRWGETVYEGRNFQPNDPAFGWDGTHRDEPMNPAVFAYFAIVELADGQVVLYEGDVTLAR